MAAQVAMQKSGVHLCSDNVYIGGQRSAIRAGEPIRANRGHDTKNLYLTGFVLLHPRNFVTLLAN